MCARSSHLLCLSLIHFPSSVSVFVACLLPLRVLLSRMLFSLSFVSYCFSLLPVCVFSFVGVFEFVSHSASVERV